MEVKFIPAAGPEGRRMLSVRIIHVARCVCAERCVCKRVCVSKCLYEGKFLVKVGSCKSVWASNASQSLM